MPTPQRNSHRVAKHPPQSYTKRNSFSAIWNIAFGFAWLVMRATRLLGAMDAGSTGMALKLVLPGSATMNVFSVTTAIVWRKKPTSDAKPGTVSCAKRRNEERGSRRSAVDACSGSSNVSSVWLLRLRISQPP